MGWNKFGNEQTSVGGRSFPSKLEASVFAMLKGMEAAGQLKILKLQDSIYLSEAKILYKPDFKCELYGGQEIWVEAKGYETPEWRIKRRLWMSYGPGELWIYKGSHLRPVLHEVLKSKI